MVNTLDVKNIRPHLRQARVISEQDYIELLKMPEDSPRKQAEILVQIVKQKGTGFRKFLRVLKNTAADNQGHQDIIFALESDIGYQRNQF